MKTIYKQLFLFCIVLFVFQSCVEPFETGTENFEDILVVEATITNELKYQEILLSRTSRLEEENMFYELNAQVTVIDDAKNTYNFQEIDSGKYKSTIKFKAELNTSYTLKITTEKGKSYTSNSQQLSSIKGIDSLYAVKSINNFGKDGISILVDSYDPDGNSKYYRYEYVETYQVLAPYAVLQKKRVCYKTVKTNIIKQKQTIALSEDRIKQLPIIFINESDYKTTYRYSILVKQYVQSQEAFSYYKTLNKFSGLKSVLSQVQKGVFLGNITADKDREEIVLGFFEVTSVSSKRIYFKHHDFFPDNPYPRYFRFCDLRALSVESILSGDWVYAGVNEAGNPLMVETECGDCTSFASNVKPTFWID